MLCCRVLQWRVEKPTFWASFHRMKDSFSREISKEGSWAHFRSLEPIQPIPIIHNAVSAGNCIILEGNFRRGSSGSFRAFSYGWRVQPFIGGDLGVDLHQIYVISASYLHVLQFAVILQCLGCRSPFVLGVYPETLLGFSWICKKETRSQFLNIID